MKLKTIFFTFIALGSALPIFAQTGAPLPSVSQGARPPLMMDALRNLRLGGGPRPRTPQQKALEDAKMDKINDLTQAGTQALRLKNFVTAEADYRELLQMEPFFYNYYGLGEALAGQGRTAEAIAAYRTAVYWPLNTTPEAIAASQAIENKPNLRGCSFPIDAVAWMKYVLLLSQTGQNAEAFSVYIQALRLAPDTAHPDMKISFATGQPAPTELQSAAHIALGLLVNNTGNDREQALSEFEQARKLAPDTAAANYYYGYGWKRLDPNSPAKAAHAQEAKAALAKAAASDDGSIKKAATEEAKGL